MKKNLLPICLLSLLAVVSCTKATKQASPAPAVTITTNSITPPIGFKWESSRNINFTIAVIDDRFQSSMFLISIYDGDPIAGGNLISKGSATTSTAFSAKLYLSKQISQVVIVKTAPDGTKVTKKIQVGDANISLSIGAQ